MKGTVVKFLLKTAWVLELIIALFILVVTVVQMVLTGKDSLDYLTLGQFSLNEFFANTMNIIVGLEFVKMLILHTPQAVTDVLLFAIARQLVVTHSSSMDTLLGVAAVALIFVIKKFLLSQEDSVPPKDILSKFSQEFKTRKEEAPHHE
ncbi:hypothetical protein [Flavonifractor plautii]|uniref:Transporter n=1 Tax=Candidatus Flavonifractor intestinigallinarum TaxID=2838586 RepID=A0A9D2MM25_9FIRM|nr:hypothetical protein [Flavonifractor plautii]MBM6665380.1 hypothetical protein [Flavonifractor plautii]HJB79598.1 hypothetical protein [Candidatus Flavonifractor intestinigallinarum]